MEQHERAGYRGFVIRPAPAPLRDGRWNHDLYVGRDKGSEFVERKFTFASSSATREEAISHGMTAGQKIINGEVPNCSVADL